jgi:hypothetical protein
MYERHRQCQLPYAIPLPGIVAIPYSYTKNLLLSADDDCSQLRADMLERRGAGRTPVYDSIN